MQQDIDRTMGCGGRSRRVVEMDRGGQGEHVDTHLFGGWRCVGGVGGGYIVSGEFCMGGFPMRVGEIFGRRFGR